MSYDDGRVALTDDELVIRAYYFPFGAAKHIRYADISGVRRTPLTKMGGKYRIWGSGDFRHWWNLDPGRGKKSTALVIELAGQKATPVITPDQPDAVADELAAHGIEITGG